VQIIFNGEPCEVPERASVAELLDRWRLSARHVAVELNLELVPRAEHAQRRLSAGDRMEVVTLVGGG
jgi:sulfur carrier protein